MPYIEVPASYRSPIVTRIKIMCDLDISERRKPQDGKIKFRRFGPLDIELRVATVPTTGGMEDVVMRLLGQQRAAAARPAGPARRTTTSASSRRDRPSPTASSSCAAPPARARPPRCTPSWGTINTPDTKIWTAEDPVEITQKGLRQVQVNRKAGHRLSDRDARLPAGRPRRHHGGRIARPGNRLASGSRPPLTGHLVFSTLHTNSAPESIVRLLDMGMDPFNFADALLGVLAQRLAKRLCSKCKQGLSPGRRRGPPSSRRLLRGSRPDPGLPAKTRASPGGGAGRLAPALRRHARPFSLDEPAGEHCTGRLQGPAGPA